MALIALLTNNDDDVYCFRKELIQAILSDGHDMIISCPDGPKFELMKEMNFIHDKLYIDRRGTNPIADWKLFLHYKKLFKKYRPDVVLTYTAKPNVYGSIAARSLRIPVINNVTGFGSVLNMGGLKRAMITALFKYAYRRSACVMFQNSTNMELAQKSGMVYGECHLIPGSGIDTKRFPLQDYPEGGDGKSGPPIIFNYIGRILHDKGVDDYIEAAKRIKKDFPNALCSEMEASAVGHTCYKFGVPFIITRSLSDVYGHGESSMQFDEYLKIASENSAKLCVELVKA